MISMHQDGGSSEIQLVGIPRTAEWRSLKPRVIHLLQIRGGSAAATILESLAFDLYSGTNGFGDEFSLLYLSAPIDQYVSLAERSRASDSKSLYSSIARTVNEIGPYIRFIAIGLDSKTTDLSIQSPSLAITSDTVERALADCEQLINTSGAASGVDRIHTAFHGYLLAVCNKASIAVPRDAGLTSIFKLVRKQHPSFAGVFPEGSSIDRILNSTANILEALNPVRNRASLAHANPEVLNEAEAMLVINSTRTLLHYLNAKLP
jgi:hypothetical protein